MHLVCIVTDNDMHTQAVFLLCGATSGRRHPQNKVRCMVFRGLLVFDKGLIFTEIQRMCGILRAAGLWQRAHLHRNTEDVWYFEGCWSLTKGSSSQKYRGCVVFRGLLVFDKGLIFTEIQRMCGISRAAGL